MAQIHLPEQTRCVYVWMGLNTKKWNKKYKRGQWIEKVDEDLQKIQGFLIKFDDILDKIPLLHIW